jgi:hypothetical protein
MTTPRTTWPAQIAVVLLLAAGMASGATSFLSWNSPLGKNAAEAGFCRAGTALSGEPHRGCGDFKQQDAADLFVAPARTVPNEINFGRAGRTVPNEINFGRAGRVVPDEINVADQLWQQTWREAQGMNLNPRRVVEGAIDLETGVPAVRASGTPPASSLALPGQAERFPPGVCGMPRAVQAVIDQTGAADNLILATQGGFRFRNGRWYYVSPCRNCEGIFGLNPNLQRSPLPPGVPPGLPPNTQIPFTPPPGW